MTPLVQQPTRWEIHSTTASPNNKDAIWHLEQGDFSGFDDAAKAAHELMENFAAADPGFTSWPGRDKFMVTDAGNLTKIQYRVQPAAPELEVQQQKNAEGADLRQDTPALSQSEELPTSEEIMQIKQEEGAAMLNSENGVPTVVPQGREGLAGAGGSDTSPIEIADGVSQASRSSETVVNDETVLNGGNEVKQPTIAEALSPQKSPEKALPEQPTPKEPSPAPEEPSSADPAPGELTTEEPFKEASPQQSLQERTSQIVPEPEANSSNPGIDDVELAAHAHPTPIEQPPKTSPPNYFGLYITMSTPPAPAVTYRMQLNTSLGQAQSDMRIIFTNELNKALARGIIDHDMHFKMSEWSIEALNKKYEIVKGEFVEGAFVSDMERSGRATGESYTREMMGRMPAAPIVAQVEEGDEDADVEARVDSPQPLDEATSRKRGRTSEQEADHSVHGHGARDEHQESSLPPFKKRKTDDAPQNSAGQQEGVHEQTIPSALKRTRDPAEDLDDDDASNNDIPTQPPSKKVKLVTFASDLDADGSPDPSLPAPAPALLLAPAPIDTTPYCRCHGPDDGSQMVGCDNDDCPNNGWAHWACIETERAMPGGEESWLCPDCDPARRKKKGGAVYGWTKSALAKGAARRGKGKAGKRG